MTADKRSSDRKQIDAMTQDFLAKGGKIVQCPPGASEEVVYRKNTFRRRARPAAGETAPEATGETAPETTGAAPETTGAAPETTGAAPETAGEPDATAGQPESLSESRPEAGSEG